MGDYIEVEQEMQEEIQTQTLEKQMYHDFSTIGKTLLLYMALQGAAGLLFGFFLVSLTMQNRYGTWDVSQVDSFLLVAGFIISFLVFWYAHRHLRATPNGQEAAPTWRKVHIFRYAIVMLGLNQAGGLLVMLINTILDLMGKAELSSPDFSLQGNIAFNLLMLLSVVVVAPFFEEYLFRGVIFRTLQRYDTRFAIFISALLFAGMHMNLVQGIPTFFIGLVCAYVAYQSNALWPCILLHFINNGLVSLIEYATLDVAWGTILVEGFFFACMLYACYRIWKRAVAIHRELQTATPVPHLYKRFFCCWSTVIFLSLVILFSFMEFFL